MPQSIWQMREHEPQSLCLIGCRASFATGRSLPLAYIQGALRYSPLVYLLGYTLCKGNKASLICNYCFMFQTQTASQPYLSEGGNSGFQLSDQSANFSQDQLRRVLKSVTLSRRNPIKNLFFTNEKLKETCEFLSSDAKPVSKTNKTIISARGNTQRRQSSMLSRTNLMRDKFNATTISGPKITQIQQAVLIQQNQVQSEAQKSRAKNCTLSIPLNKVIATKNSRHQQFKHNSSEQKNMQKFKQKPLTIKLMTILLRQVLAARVLISLFCNADKGSHQLFPALTINALSATKIPREIAITRVPRRRLYDSLKRKDIQLSSIDAIETRSLEQKADPKSYYTAPENIE